MRMRPRGRPLVRRMLAATRRKILQKSTWLAIAAAVLAATAAPSSAQTQNNLVGAYAGTTTQAPVPGNPPTLFVDLTVAGFASQLGQFAGVGQMTVNLATGTYVGSYTFTAANGDTLTATTSGIRLLCLSAGVFSLEEHFTITGGTGGLTGATGGGSGLGVFGSANNQIALVFTGALSTTSAPSDGLRHLRKGLFQRHSLRPLKKV